MSRLVVAFAILAGACREAPMPEVATGFPADLILYECWMHVRWVQCVAPESRDPFWERPSPELGGPRQDCPSTYWVHPSGACHDPTALQHCLRGIEQRARTCDDPMPAACAYVYRPC